MVTAMLLTVQASSQSACRSTVSSFLRTSTLPSSRLPASSSRCRGEGEDPAPPPPRDVTRAIPLRAAGLAVSVSGGHAAPTERGRGKCCAWLFGRRKIP